MEARGDNVTRDGVRYDNQYCMIFRIENGRIKQIKEYWTPRWSSACSVIAAGSPPRWRVIAAALNWGKIGGNRMNKQFFSPATLPPPVGYSHVARSTGKR